MRHDGTIRAFIAVDLGDAARRAAAELSRALAGAPGGDTVRWVRPEALHVTLRFLGDVERSRTAEIAAGVAERLARVAPFRLELGGAGVFPSARQPRVVMLALAPEAPLAALADAVERGVTALGFEPEARAFRPHLTLGRVRGRRAPELSGAAPPPPSPFQVRETLLYQSQLGPGGSRYTPLERMPLGGRDHPN